MANYGRNRQSIADIQQELHDIFDQHPQSHANDAGEPVIPADALVDIFRKFSEVYHGVELMTSDEMDMLKSLLASNPGLEVTPQIMLQFIAEKTKHSPRSSPPITSDEEDTLGYPRGRLNDRGADSKHGSRSSSSDSATTSFAQTTSRPPSRGPQTPASAKGPSPFDGSKRQRTTPLSAANAPSSWSKPTPAHRRKSDAGSRSDSESYSSPSAFRRGYSRSRAPSNPTSPTVGPVATSPYYSGSRPQSRNQSHQSLHFGNGNKYRRGSTDDHVSPIRMRSPVSDLEDDLINGDSFINNLNSLPMPRSPGDPDSDVEDSTLGLVMDRSAAVSTISLDAQERLDVLQRANAELSKKLMEAEKTLQNKLEEHEMELEEMQSRLEEIRSELSATKREEKELRSKERQNSTQIAALESEIGKLQKSLENARATYSSLQKQYQEQCTESERYRNTLRRRDQEIKDFQEAAALQAIENQKWIKEHDNYEDRITQLEAELSVAQQAQMQLDEQKQENLMLKETIDRMRFDMDELRSSFASAAIRGSSGGNSAANTISKSLGVELLGKMKSQWGMEDETEDTLEGEDAEELVMNDDLGGDATEGMDVIQTIITRKKRKVASRAQRVETRRFEELKEYADAYTQHEASDFVASRTTQTDLEPKLFTTSAGVQTEDHEAVPLSSPVASVSTETQSESHRSPSPVDDDALASSSSTVRPPTPKSPTSSQLHAHTNDLPPSYHQISGQNQDERDWRVAAETLEKWHKGAKIPFQPAPNPLSDDALEGWRVVKDELGIECLVIDKVIATSERTRAPRAVPSASKDDDTPSSSPKPSAKGRFYNIYNTYVYGKDGSSSFPAQFALGVGATALVFLAMSPYMVPHYSIPGGPTYYDRTAWTSFNTMQATGEGFSADGTAAVWNFLGRVGGGAARIARGWPT